MFLRKKTKKQNGKTYTYYQLVEAYATPKGPRQRVVTSLGDLAPRPREEWLQLVRQVEADLSGQMDFTVEAVSEEARAVANRVRQKRRRATGVEEEEVVAICIDRVETEKARELGPAYVGVTMWERLGLDKILAECGLSEMEMKRTQFLTMNALCERESEHAMPNWGKRTAVGDLIGLDTETVSESTLYRTLDAVWPHRERIEQALAEREGELFALDNTVILYDLTSTYFEGEMKRNPSAKRGYSRDHRSDCKQVVVGLVLDTEGFVKGHEIFAGNRRDNTTLQEMVALLDQRMGNKKAMVVMDRGLATQENLKWLQEEKRPYLVATQQGERDKWIDEFLSGEWEELQRPGPPTQPEKKRCRVEIKREERDGILYVLCRSEGRTEKDAAIRKRFEEQMEVDLEKLRKTIASGRLKQLDKIHERIGRLKERYPRVARYYDIQVVVEQETPRLEWNQKEEQWKQAEELDGTYLLQTNRLDWSTEDVWKTYIMLTHVESAFRHLKSTLNLRPICHHREDRGEAHIFVILLAYHHLHLIEMTLRQNGEYRSWQTIRKELRSHQVNTVVLPASNGDMYMIRKPTVAEKHQRDIYEKLGMDPEVNRYPRSKRKYRI